jgi:serine/threonine protein kinase
MELPCDRIGPYRLTRRIGSGGIGQVFAAVHERMDQEVALKILSPESAADPQLVARFLQEARALAGLQHAGVVRALHCDRLPDGTAFLAMEYLDGETLRQWSKRQEGPVPLEAALFIAREIADAMVEVHGKGIVHRDLKPENIMLVADAGSPIGHRVKLLDFGIAKVPRPVDEAHADTRVQTGAPTLLGTATYMAPEQCRNVADVTDRADVYALGAVLFELLTGLRIEGPGGSGKTSLVQAAVLPGLGHRFAAGTPWLVATLRPTAAPLSSLAGAVALILGERADELEAAMRADEAALASILRRSQPSGALLLLAIDQLEELFTRGAPDLERFDALLFHALTAPAAPFQRTGAWPRARRRRTLPGARPVPAAVRARGHLVSVRAHRLPRLAPTRDLLPTRRPAREGSDRW